MIVLARAAHEWGMEVCQFIWGQSLFEEGQNFCWHNPAERAMMRTEYARLARLYGKSVDHIVVHVGDPGGCVRNGCDPFKTTQEIATAIWAEYKKVNPQCTATLSTWANFGFWDNRNDSAFLDQTYSSMDMAIALHRWYDEDKVSLLRSTGREIDIWGWYLSDYEMSCNSHLLMQRLDRYYSTLPVEASATIRTLSTEICYSGLPSQINVYISAQKMWDPYRSLEDIEIEFCRGTFGPNQAIPILTIYKVCEEYVHPENYYYFIPATDCLPVVFGTTEYNTRLECAMALTTKVIFDDSEPLGLTSATPPSILYHYLNRQLHLISIFSQTKAVIKALSLSCGDPDQRDDLICKAINQAEPYKETLDYQHLIHDVEA